MVSNWFIPLILGVVISWLLVVVVIATPLEFCPMTVVNPTCRNGKQKSTDYHLPCVTEASCMGDMSDLNGPVDCFNWFCSLRLNCGCFAGQVTSCAANATTCNKDGCYLVSSMFQDLNCNYSSFLGHRNSSEYFTQYIDQCLGGCNAATARHSFSWCFYFLLCLLFFGDYF